MKNQIPEAVNVRPFRGGWQVQAGADVEPYFIGDDAKETAIRVALRCASDAGTEVRIFAPSGDTERVVRTLRLHVIDRKVQPDPAVLQHR